MCNKVTLESCATCIHTTVSKMEAHHCNLLAARFDIHIFYNANFKQCHVVVHMCIVVCDPIITCVRNANACIACFYGVDIRLFHDEI